MSQFPHDEFVKEYIPELIKDYGNANSGENVVAQRREIDVFFQPTTQVPNTSETVVGLLGKLAQRTCLFEVFRNPVEPHQIPECMGKLFDVQSAIRREKRKNQDKISQEEPFLWILTPTLSAEKLELFGAKNKSGWPSGVYFLAEGLNTGIVVIHQLPVNKDTLWLRILGKGKVQENAIDEVKSLPKDHPHRDNVLELIGNLFAMLEINKKQGEKLAQEDQELIMKLSPIYVERLAQREKIGLEKGVQQGLQQGLQQEANLLIIRLLKRKLGNLPPNLESQIGSLPLKSLEDLGEALLDFNSLDNLIDWLDNN